MPLSARAERPTRCSTLARSTSAPHARPRRIEVAVAVAVVVAFSLVVVRPLVVRVACNRHGHSSLRIMKQLLLLSSLQDQRLYNSDAQPLQRPMQPPTAGGLSWWLWPLRGGHGRGLRRFAAVVAEVFAPSWWSRRRSFIHRHKNNAKKRFTCDFRLFHHRNLLGVCASSRHLRRQAIFSAKS